MWWPCELTALGNLFWVKPNSVPNPLVDIGPKIATEVSELPTFAFSNTQLLFNPSYINDAVVNVEPESTTLIPAKFEDGVSAFKVTNAAPIAKFEEVIFWIDEEPWTTKSCVIYNEPVIVWFPVNTFVVFNLAKEDVNWDEPDITPFVDAIEPVNELAFIAPLTYKLPVTCTLSVAGVEPTNELTPFPMPGPINTLPYVGSDINT